MLVFLLGDWEKVFVVMDCDLLEFVDEFVWILEDIVDFIVGCVVVVMICYC